MKVPVHLDIPEKLKKEAEEKISQEEQAAAENLMKEEEPEQPEEDLLFDEPFQKERIGWSKKQVLLLIALAVLLLMGIGMMILFLPKSDGHVIINEVMSSNDKAFVHEQYGSVDWIELYNPTQKDADLSGYGLTDELKKQYKYMFPEGTVLKSGEYLILYCTGGTSASDSDPYCTGFALSQEGETLYLLDRSYLELDSVTVPYLETDSSYARGENGVFTVTKTVTPGKVNEIGN